MMISAIRQDLVLVESLAGEGGHRECWQPTRRPASHLEATEDAQPVGQMQQQRTHRFSMKLTSMAARGAKAGKTLLGGGRRGLCASWGGQGSETSNEDDDSFDELESEDSESEPSPPVVAINAASVAQAARDASNNSRRANLKLSEAEYWATGGRRELDQASRSAEVTRARLKALEIMEVANRASAAVADAAAASKAVRERGGSGSGARGAAAAAGATAAAPVRRVRTGGPGRQGSKPFPRDGALPVRTGPGGGTESGKPYSSIISGALPYVRPTPGAPMIVEAESKASAAASTSPWATVAPAPARKNPAETGFINGPAAAATVAGLRHGSAPPPPAVVVTAMEEDVEEDKTEDTVRSVAPTVAATTRSRTNGQIGGSTFPVTVEGASVTAMAAAQRGFPGASSDGGLVGGLGWSDASEVRPPVGVVAVAASQGVGTDGRGGISFLTPAMGQAGGEEGKEGGDHAMNTYDEPSAVASVTTKSTAAAAAAAATAATSVEAGGEVKDRSSSSPVPIP